MFGQRSADAAAALCRESSEKLKATAGMIAVQLNLSLLSGLYLFEITSGGSSFVPCLLQVRSTDNVKHP